MMLSELMNELEKLYAKHGNIPVKVIDNEWLELRDIKLTFFPKGKHHVDITLPDMLEIDSI